MYICRKHVEFVQQQGNKIFIRLPNAMGFLSWNTLLYTPDSPCYSLLCFLMLHQDPSEMAVMTREWKIQYIYSTYILTVINNDLSQECFSGLNFGFGLFWQNLSLFECISENSHSTAKTSYMEIAHLENNTKYTELSEDHYSLSGLLYPVWSSSVEYIDIIWCVSRKGVSCQDD